MLFWTLLSTVDWRGVIGRSTLAGTSLVGKASFGVFCLETSEMLSRLEPVLGGEPFDRVDLGLKWIC
jgi:hypothetical protein